MDTLSLKHAFPIYGYESPILISKEKGCLCIPLELKLPEIFSLDKNDYAKFNRLFSNIISTLGENTLVHKQDLFFTDRYKLDQTRIDRDFFESEDELHFTNRPFLNHRSFLGLHLVPKNYFKSNPLGANGYLKKVKNGLFDRIISKEYSDKTVLEAFRLKAMAINQLINESELLSSTIVNFEHLFEKDGYYSNYLEATFEEGAGVDIDFENATLFNGKKQGQFFTLENLDQFETEAIFDHSYYGKYHSDEHPFPIGNLFSLGFKIPYEHIINQYIYLPPKEAGINNLKKRTKRLNKYANNRKGDKNSIYRNQIQQFEQNLIEEHQELVYYHLNVLGYAEHHDDFGMMCNTIKSAFKKIGVHVKTNSVDRKNLFFAGILGNAIGISSELYSPMSSKMAASLLYSEGGYKNPVHGLHGLRMIDRATHKPLLVSLYREPEKNHWIFNRGMLIASGSGGGKTYFANAYLYAEYREGAEVIILENGNSYDKLTGYLDGVTIEHDDDRPFSFNPFVLDEQDYHMNQNNLQLGEHKLTQLIVLLKLILGHQNSDKNTTSNSIIQQTIFERLISGYYQESKDKNQSDYGFNSFYSYCVEALPVLLRKHKINPQTFDSNTALMILGNYAEGGPREYLLNSKDERISKLTEERWIYFKLGNLIENQQLFPIISFLLMDVFNKKLKDPKKLSINKILNVDEAWNLFDNEIMAQYLNAQSRMARKYGGQPIFISQKVDDFITSKHIGKTLVVNSHIKVLLDMAEYSNDFDDIQEILGLTAKQKQMVLSLNKDISEKRKYREIAICWKEKVGVYGLETSISTKCLFETNPNEKALINSLLEKNKNDWKKTALHYKELTNKNQSL
ncbi:TraG family conjugative transposon ATPase [Maribacter sp. CXY002]|uniref:TraG family conjugative transposon ATPase n=1 Tax=Maribacter luteocoastalis TaxID=3407671 RepID=UPI003B674182